MIGPVASEAATEICLAVPALAALLASGEVELAASTERLCRLGGYAIFGCTRAIGHARPGDDRVRESGEAVVATNHSHYPDPVVLVAGTANVCSSCILDFLYSGEVNGIPVEEDLGEAVVESLVGLAVAVSLASPLAPVCQIQLDDLERALRDL